MNAARLQTMDLVLSTREIQYRSLQEATPRAVTPSAMSAHASASTATSAQFTAAHVGCIVVPEDGDCRGNPAQIVAIDTGTGIATFDRGYHSVSGCTRIRMWNPPEVPVVPDSATSGSITDASHASITGEGDDVHNDRFLLGKNGSNKGGAFRITDFATSGGVFTISAPPATPVVKELYLLRSMHRPMSFSSTVDQEVIDRRLQGFGDADQSVPTISPGTWEGVWEVKPVSASAGSGTAATPPYEMGDFLRDTHTETKDTGTTYSSQGGSAPTGITITVADASGLSVGGFVLMSTGEASQITDKSSNTITCPQLTAATNVALSVVYGSAWYKRFEASQSGSSRTRTFDHYIGRLLRHYLMGCAATDFTLEMTRDHVWTFSMKGTATDALEYTVSDPNGLAGYPFDLSVDQTVPVDGKGSRFLINSVPVFVNSVKFAWNVKALLRQSMSGMNQADGYAFDPQPVTVSVDGYLADNDDNSSYQRLPDRIRTGNVCSLFSQKGSNPKETFCIAAPTAQIKKVSGKHNGGMYEFSFDAICVKPQLVRGGSYNASLPALSVGWAG
jgi:hypothetical protein